MHILTRLQGEISFFYVGNASLESRALTNIIFFFKKKKKIAIYITIKILDSKNTYIRMCFFLYPNFWNKRNNSSPRLKLTPSFGNLAH